MDRDTGGAVLMGIETLDRYTCDICHDTTDDMEEAGLWAVIRVEDKTGSRPWGTKVICGECVEKIKKNKEY